MGIYLEKKKKNLPCWFSQLAACVRVDQRARRGGDTAPRAAGARRSGQTEPGV